MRKLLILQGLPASGKSTYAKELLAKDPTFKRVNRDSLRDMVDAGKWSQNREKLIRKSQLALAELYLSENFDIVVDDTNLSPSAQEMWRQFAEKHKAKLETKFFDTPVEECIKRDLVRPNSVGQDVIMRMHNDFLKPKPEIYTPPAGKPLAIMCDIDGTLAHMTLEGRLRFGKQAPFMWKNVGEDAVDETVTGLLRDLQDKHTIILISGRDSVCRPETIAWLESNAIPFDCLYMRDADDNRKDFIIKRELFDKHIRDNYRVEFVLDDRTQVVRVWRSMGLKVFQVDEGDF